MSLYDLSHALTLWEPWCSAIVFGSKRIENRTWVPPLEMIGKRIWLHAGKTWDKDGATFCAKRGFVLLKGGERADHRVGAHRRIPAPRQAARRDDLRRRSRSHEPGIAAAIGERGPTRGPVGWVLDDVVPVPQPYAKARGLQKLWRVPDDVRAELKELRA